MAKSSVDLTGLPDIKSGGFDLDHMVKMASLFAHLDDQESKSGKPAVPGKVSTDNPFLGEMRGYSPVTNIPTDANLDPASKNLLMGVGLDEAGTGFAKPVYYKPGSPGTLGMEERQRRAALYPYAFSPNIPQDQMEKNLLTMSTEQDPVEMAKNIQLGPRQIDPATTDKYRQEAENRSLMRQIDYEYRAEARKLEAEERAAGRMRENERLNVPPVAKEKYIQVASNLKLAERLEAGLTYAQAKNIDVTGLLNYPIARFKEFLNALPTKEAVILGDLRENFALYGRQMGGTSFTETEKSIFTPIMPDILQPTGTNLDRITRSIRSLRDIQGLQIEVYPGLKETIGVKGLGNAPTTGKVKSGLTFTVEKSTQ